jgi:hypothetical protein
MVSGGGWAARPTIGGFPARGIGVLDIGVLGIDGTEAMLGQLGLQAILDQELGGNTGLCTAGDCDVVSGYLMRLTCVVERF